jgi:hypothetical protein
MFPLGPEFNVLLLNDFLDRPQKTVVHSRMFVAILCILMFGVVILIGMLGFLLMRWLWLSIYGVGSLPSTPALNKKI